jgi:glycyl-tRNA synthetase
MQVASVSEYRTALAAAGIMVGLAQRTEAIWGGVTAAAEAIGGHVPPATREGLLPEVVNLVESPTVVLGTFDRRFLELPRWEPCGVADGQMELVAGLALEGEFAEPTRC